MFDVVKQFAGDYPKYMKQDGSKCSGGDYDKHTKQHAGDYSNYMKQRSSAGSGGNYEKYMM